MTHFAAILWQAQSWSGVEFRRIPLCYTDNIHKKITFVKRQQAEKCTSFSGITRCCKTVRYEN
jgi:hypothetical protein